jgi:predicted Fe-Mo cluster-binding NifX family protein
VGAFCFTGLYPMVVRVKEQGGDPMKIAVGTDDKKTIRKGHFGDARHYLILGVLNAEVVAREWRTHTRSEEDEGSHHHGRPEGILDLLNDCELFMGRSFGKGSLPVIKSRGVDCILTGIVDIEAALSAYLGGQDEGFRYYDKEMKAFVPCAERAFGPQQD